MAELSTAEQAAYNAGFNLTKKQAARREGVADAGGDPIVEAARQRALAPQQLVAGSPNPPVGRVQPKPSGEFIQRPDGSRVPAEYYDLPPEQKARFDALLKGEESEAANESLALQYSKSVGDQQEEQGRRISALESQLNAALSAMEAMQRRMKAIDTSVEVAKSDALIDAESQLAQTIVNAGAVKAQLDSSTASSAREMEVQQADHRARFEASERVLGEMKGRLKSAGTLYQERGNAVVSQLAAIEGRVATAEVTQTEIDNGIKVNRDTLRAATGDDLKSVVDMNVKQAFDDRLDGAMDDLIQRKYVLLAPTNGTDGYDPKRDELTKPFLAEQVGDNATERAVKRALKKAGRD